VEGEVGKGEKQKGLPLKGGERGETKLQKNPHSIRNKAGNPEKADEGLRQSMIKQKQKKKKKLELREKGD